MSGELSDLLAVLPYAALATWSLLVAGSFLAIMRSYGRSWGLIAVGVMAFTLLAVFFFMLAITGGSDPVIPRRLMVLPIRAVAVAALVAGCIWIVQWARVHVSVRWRSRVNGTHG